MNERAMPKPNCTEEVDMGMIEFGRLGRRVVEGRFDVVGVMAFYAIYLAAWSGLALMLGLSRWSLLGTAVAAAQALWHYTLIRTRSRDGCFKAFRLNHWVGFAVFAGTVLASR